AVQHQIRVLFVCLGNICRSPLAEGLFTRIVQDAGMAHRFQIDSAGIADYHIGKLPDSRTREVAERNGLRLSTRARQITRTDLEEFDYVLVMDASNLADVQDLTNGARPRCQLHRLREFDPEANGELDVPDPY